MILIAELISHFVNGNVNMATVKKMSKAQSGKRLPEIKKDNTRSVKVNPSYKKSNSGDLNNAELSALAHQKRGMGNATFDHFVKKAGSIQNETAWLNSKQSDQLKKYMDKAGTAKKIYEGLPNVGRMLGHGNSAADIPKGSQLEKQKKGGKISKTAKPKMKSGGMLKRADGSYSKRGLWDNIRANKGSGKKPTAAMLKQEKKIKAKSK
jgi:hypothetical protein